VDSFTNLLKKEELLCKTTCASFSYTSSAIYHCVRTWYQINNSNVAMTTTLMKLKVLTQEYGADNRNEAQQKYH